MYASSFIPVITEMYMNYLITAIGICLAGLYARKYEGLDYFVCFCACIGKSVTITGIEIVIAYFAMRYIPISLQSYLFIVISGIAFCQSLNSIRRSSEQIIEMRQIYLRLEKYVLDNIHTMDRKQFVACTKNMNENNIALNVPKDIRLLFEADVIQLGVRLGYCEANNERR